MVVSNVDIFQGTVSGVTHFKYCDNIIMCTSFQFVNPCYLLDEFQGIISRIDKIVFSNENCTFDQFICVTYSGHQSSKSSLKSCFTSFSFASFFFFIENVAIYLYGLLCFFPLWFCFYWISSYFYLYSFFLYSVSILFCLVSPLSFFWMNALSINFKKCILLKDKQTLTCIALHFVLTLFLQCRLLLL